MPTELKHTVKASGGDFTTVYDAVEHIKSSHSNLVTADVYATIEISGAFSAPETAKWVFTGITTDATHYLRIYTIGSARHAGVWNTNAHILEVTDDSTTTNTNCNYIQFDGLQIHCASATGTQRNNFNYSAIGASNLTQISNCIIRGHGSDYAEYCVYPVTNLNVDMWNCIIYGFTGTGSNPTVFYWSAGTLNIYNAVIIGGYRGIRKVSGTVNLKNVYCGGQNGACFYGSPDTLTNCVSSDTTAGSSNGCKSSIAVSVTADSTHAGFKNVTAGSEDFHLVSTSSPLYHAGVDTSGDSAPMNFTTDIDGDTYYSTRSIGVDELGSIVAPTVTTTDASAIAPTTATSGGNVTADGGASVTHKGVCWSTSANPTTADSKTDDGTGTGSYASSLTSLSPGTLYHYRAYATNSAGTSYGADKTFTTGAAVAKVINE